MRLRTTIIAFLILSSQVEAFPQKSAGYYTRQWERIDSLIALAGLPLDAMKLVQEVQRNAIAEKKQAEYVRCLLYKIQIREMREEDAELENILLLEKMPVAGDRVLQAVQKHYLALLYLYYLRSINNFEPQNTEPNNEFPSWSAAEFHQKIGELFLASLQHKELLQKTSLNKWHSLLEVNQSSRSLRPTMYDLLAAGTLEYLRTLLDDGTRPLTGFILSSPEYLADADTFCKIRMPINDSASALGLSIKIYQELLSFHKKFNNRPAWGDINLARIEFVHMYGSFPNKDSLYLSALGQVIKEHGSGAIADQARYMMAEWYADNAAIKGPNTAKHLATARNICEETIRFNDSSEGVTNCRALLEKILQKNLYFITEKVNLPDAPFRMLVTYKNTGRIFFRLYRLNNQEAIGIRQSIYYKETFWDDWSKRPPLREWFETLPDGDDLQEHSVEVKIDALPFGSYLMLASIDSGFSTTANQLALQQFHISSMGWMQSDKSIYIVDRRSGLPCSNIPVKIWTAKHVLETGETALNELEQLVTDTAGRVEFLHQETYPFHYLLQADRGDDRLFLENQLQSPIVYHAPENVKKAIQGFLYTDRSIYRPQQQVFFKGVVTGKEKDSPPQPETSFYAAIYLIDPTGRRIDSAFVTTNSFGSYSGNFTLPRIKMLGTYTLWDTKSYAQASIRVEEYKRPRFEVQFTESGETYRLGDTITIRGKAEAYAGETVNNAKVTYTIKRKKQYNPYQERYQPAARFKPMRHSQLMAAGSVQTGSDGSFSLRFKASPDPFESEEREPLYDFEVHTDVTDIQGETQSATWSLPVGRKSMQLLIEASDLPEVKDTAAIRILTQNLSGVHIPSLVDVRIVSLKPPINLVRKRMWPVPDRFKYSEQDFKSWFPLDEFANETNPENWVQRQEVLKTRFASQPSGTVSWMGTLNSPGWYELNVQTMDAAGETFMASKIIHIQGANESSSPLLEANLKILNGDVEPGDTVRYQVQSNMDSLWLLTTFSRMDQFHEITGSVSQRTVNEKIPVRETDRGGFYVTTGFYRHNRFFIDQKKIEVPFSNKDLSIQYTSFGQRSQPGTFQKWGIRIKDRKGLPVNAEITSTLYDASLEQFSKHQWFKPGLWMKFPPLKTISSDQSFPVFPLYKNFYLTQWNFIQRKYEYLLPIFTHGIAAKLLGRTAGPQISTMQPLRDAENTTQISVAYDELNNESTAQEAGILRPDPSKMQNIPKGVAPLRKDFRETAFFEAHAITDSNGNAEMSFRLPEVLGRWKWMTLAHTKDLSLGYSDTFAITQQPLMLQANPPRFFREGDRMDYPVKISNTSDKELTGQVQLLLVDPESGESVDGWFQNFFPNQYFTVPAGESTVASFTMEIPYRYNKPVAAKVIARTEEYSDGEERIIPVLSNRIMVTESRSLPLEGNKDIRILFEKLKESGNSSTLHHHALTFEYTSNPFWYAVQNLPYLSSLPDESIDQTFIRFFANSLSSWVLKKTPGIKTVLEKWRKGDSLTLPSLLERNESITQTLLEETPWVTEARSSRSLQNKMIGHFTTDHVQTEMKAAWDKLRNSQNSDGSFSWFPDGPPNITITLQVLSGLAQLRNSGICSELDTVVLFKGLSYLDHWMATTLKNAQAGSTPKPDTYIIYYLYLRSFFPSSTLHDTLRKPYSYYYGFAKNKWNQYNKRLQAMIALSCFRNGDVQTAKNIVASLLQNALFSNEIGMYWKEYNTAGYSWDESPVESHTLLMHAIKEITNNDTLQDKMKKWLLQQKQTQHWSTTAATAEACYALLQDPGVLSEDSSAPLVRMGSMTLRPTPQEAGTGFSRTTIPGEKVTPSMGEIEIRFEKKREPAAQSAWGAIHWQYMDEMDKMTATSGPLTIQKSLFIERSTDSGTTLEPVADGAVIHRGEKVVVRLIVQSERNLEFVHLKDLRAATFEPAMVLSGHQWKKGLHYYQSNKDAGMHFFFDRLPRGTHIFSYPMFVQHSGTFRNGIATVQCLYAPAYNAHTASLNFHVE